MVDSIIFFLIIFVFERKKNYPRAYNDDTHFFSSLSFSLSHEFHTTEKNGKQQSGATFDIWIDDDDDDENVIENLFVMNLYRGRCRLQNLAIWYEKISIFLSFVMMIIELDHHRYQ